MRTDRQAHDEANSRYSKFCESTCKRHMPDKCAKLCSIWKL